MTHVLNGPVNPGDLIAYSVRRHWDMATRIGVVVEVLQPIYRFYPDEKMTHPGSLLVRVVKSSDGKELTRLVWLTELDRVVKVKGLT